MGESTDINEIEERMSEHVVCDHTDDNDHNDDHCSDDYDSDEEVDDLEQLYSYIDETHKNSTHGVYSDYTKQYHNLYSQEIYEFMNWVFYTNDLNLLQSGNKLNDSKSFYTALNHFYKLPENESHDKQMEMKMLDIGPIGHSSLRIVFEEIRHLNLLYRRTVTTNESDERNRICGLFANAHTIDELKCDIQLLSDTSDEYKTIHRYVTNAGQNYFVKHIFRIERQTEEQSFEQFVDCKRMLLFHGTPIYNDGTGLPPDFSCVQHKGRESRDASDVTTIDTAIVPYGKSISAPTIIPEENIPGNHFANMQIRRIIWRANERSNALMSPYNEYLVARPEQVKLKYLVVFRKSEESLI